MFTSNQPCRQLRHQPVGIWNYTPQRQVRTVHHLVNDAIRRRYTFEAIGTDMTIKCWDEGVCRQSWVETKEEARETYRKLLRCGYVRW